MGDARALEFRPVGETEADLEDIDIIDWQILVIFRIVYSCYDTGSRKRIPREIHTPTVENLRTQLRELIRQAYRFSTALRVAEALFRPAYIPPVSQCAQYNRARYQQYADSKTTGLNFKGSVARMRGNREGILRNGLGQL